MQYYLPSSLLQALGSTVEIPVSFDAVVKITGNIQWLILLMQITPSEVVQESGAVFSELVSRICVHI